jgi:hypothetical protein
MNVLTLFVPRLTTALIKKTSVRGVGNFKQDDAVDGIGQRWTELSFRL